MVVSVVVVVVVVVVTGFYWPFLVLFYWFAPLFYSSAKSFTTGLIEIPLDSAAKDAIASKVGFILFLCLLI